MPVENYHRRFFDSIDKVGITGGTGGDTWATPEKNSTANPGKLSKIQGTEVFIQPLTETMRQGLARGDIGIVIRPENRDEQTVPGAIRIEGDYIVFGQDNQVSNGNNPPNVTESKIRQEVGVSSKRRVLVMRTDTVKYPDWSVY